jgi:hypothetical protein
MARDDHRQIRVEDGHLVVDRREVPVGERDQSAARYQDPGTRGRLPENLPVQDAGLQVEDAPELDDVGGVQMERLVVDVELDQARIRDVDDGLAGLGKAVRLLGVNDRPRFVEAVDEDSRVVDRASLVEGAPHAEVAVAEGEDGLRSRYELRVEACLDELPVIVGIDVGRWVDQLTADHQPSSASPEAPMDRSARSDTTTFAP